MSTSTAHKGKSSPPESPAENASRAPFVEQSFLLDLEGRVVAFGDSSPSEALVGMVVRVTRSASRLGGGGLAKSPEFWATHGTKVLYCGFVPEGTLAFLLNSSTPLPSLPLDVFEQIRTYLGGRETKLQEPPPPAPASATHVANAEDLAQKRAGYQRLLAEYIGPAAGYVFHKAMQSFPEGENPNCTQVLQSVAGKIADAAKRAEFLARASQIIGK